MRSIYRQETPCRIAVTMMVQSTVRAATVVGISTGNKRNLMAKKELTKPTLVTVTHWDYHQVIHYIEQKYKINVRDYANSDCHFNTWCDIHGLPQWDEKGRDRGSSQIFFTQYNHAPDGHAARPPYQDFWHIYAEYIDGNGSYLYLSFEPLYPTGDPDDDEYPDYPDWAKEILTLIRDEFSPEGKDMKCWVAW